MDALAEITRNGGTHSNRVYEAIKSAIISLELKPGAVIQEEMLAQRLGVSRTPIREAMRRLQQSGLVRMLPKKGILVSDLSVHDILEIFEVRMSVEPLAARLAARKMPLEEIMRLRGSHTPPQPGTEGYRLEYRDLHGSIAEHCGNSRLQRVLDSLMDETTRVLAMSRHDQVFRAYRLHLDIITALENRDPLAAELAMQEHLQDFHRSFVASNLEPS